MSAFRVAGALRSRGAVAASSCLSNAELSMSRLRGAGISRFPSPPSVTFSVSTPAIDVNSSLFRSSRSVGFLSIGRSSLGCYASAPYATAVGAALIENRGFSIRSSRRCFSTTETVVVKVPSMGDSITEGTINCWKKGEGDYVKQDELLAIIDTDKISVDIMAPASGVLKAIKAQTDATVAVGEELYVLETGAVPEGKSEESSSTAGGSSPSREASPSDSESPAPKEAKPVASTPPQSSASTPSTPSNAPAAPAKPAVPPSGAEAKSTRPLIADAPLSPDRKEERVPMSRLRIRVAERLKTAQNTAASLTTFNECDMGNLMAMRSELQDSFVKQHGYKFGFVSAFLLASAKALMKLPQLNGYIAETGDAIIYKNYADISVAVATPTGLLVPVIRDCEKKSMPRLEADLANYAAKAREGKIALEDMAGGTFTISNGGVFGSLMGTPILNYPQSSILGLHSIKERPVARNGEIVIRPMMYLALTYDHRIVDGREAVTFLNMIKDSIEDPRRLLLDI